MDGCDFDKPRERRATRSIKWSLGESDGTLVDYPPAGAQPPQQADLLPMWLADMDFPTAPAVIAALHERVEHGIFGYTGLDDAFYDAIVGWTQRRQGWTIDRDWVVTTSGVMPAINLLIQTFTAPGDAIIVQPPVFHPISQAVEYNGRHLLNNPLHYSAGHYAMNFAELEVLAAQPGTRAMILCSPHNPVGRVWTAAELQTVADICTNNDLLLISDEIHADLTYSWSRFVSAASLGPQYHGRLVVCSGASKAFNLPGLKTALTIIPDPGRREDFHMTLRNQNELFGANLLGTTALTAAYSAGEEWLDGLLDYLAANVELVTTFLATRLPQLSVVRPEALYLLWIDCRDMGLGGSELDRRLRGAGVWVEQGATYGAEGDGFIRMTIACPRVVLEEALERLERALG
jgi:cystathionine beta-lyase